MLKPKKWFIRLEQSCVQWSQNKTLSAFSLSPYVQVLQTLVWSYINPRRPKVFWYPHLVSRGGGGGGGGGEWVTLTYLKNGSKYEVRIWYSYCPTYLRYKCKIGFDMLIRSLPWQTECLEWHCCFSKFCDVKVNKKSTNIQMLPKMWSSTISKQNFQSLLPYSYWFQICEFQLEATPWTDLNRVVYEWLEKYGHSWKIAQYPRN